MTGQEGLHTRWRVWGVVGLLALAHMLAFVDRFALSAAAGPVKRAFALSETELGALQGLAIALPYAGLALPLGALADRWAPQRMILAGLVVWTAGGFACAFSTTALQLCAARMLIGAGQAAFVPASLALLGGLFQGAAAARPLSLFTAGATLGKSLALLASGLILALAPGAALLHRLFGDAPWRAVFALTAAPNLLLILAFALLQPGVRKPRPAADAPRPSPARSPLLSVRFLTFALVALAPIVLIQAAAAWTPLFFSRSFHLAPARAALLVGGVVLVSAPIGHLAGGQLTALALKRGVGPGRLIAACLALAAPVGAGFCFAPSLALSLAGYGLVVMLLGVGAPAGLIGVGLLAPQRRVAAANALYMAFATLIGVGLGPTLVGAMSDSLFGGGDGLRFSLVTLFVAVSLACAAIALACGHLWRMQPAAEGPEDKPEDRPEDRPEDSGAVAAQQVECRLTA